MKRGDPWVGGNWMWSLAMGASNNEIRIGPSAMGNPGISSEKRTLCLLNYVLNDSKVVTIIPESGIRS